MMHTTIDTPDIRLAKMLIARKLKDKGVDLNPDKLVATIKEDGDRDPQIRLRYPLRKVSVSLQSVLGRSESVTAEDIVEIADEQAEKYLRILRECVDLEDLLAEAKTVAKRQISESNRRGTSFKLLGVQPCTIQAREDWMPSPEVTIEMLNPGLQPERYSIVAEYPEDIVRDLTDERIVQSQTLRAVRKRWFDEVGGGGAIDAVVVAAIRASGQNVPEVIQRMRAVHHGLVLPCGDLRLNVRWKDGLITTACAINDVASYADSILTLKKAKKASKRSLAGLPARVLVDSPLLEGQTIVAMQERTGNKCAILEHRFHVFDAETLEPRDQLFPM
ncbi:hypothetical protein [Sphingomonas sp. 22R3R2A-7]|uniref:hypothetical protein n=1 Tax=Sphingomonas sp. 22R3R2A-7 TaxID=3050230 RepID=UPI002FE2258E